MMLLATLILAGACTSGRADAKEHHRVDSIPQRAPPSDSLPIGVFHARTVVVDGRSVGYQIFIPAAYPGHQRWPVILSGAGTGERGDDNHAQIAMGLANHIRGLRTAFPAVVVFPQQPRVSTMPAYDRLMVAMLDATMQEWRIDSTRQYLIGVSGGGFRLWSIAYHQPTRFAALVPISAGIAPADYGEATQDRAIRRLAPALRELPIRQYNGTADKPVPIGQYAYPLRDAFQALAAPHFQFIEMEGATHSGTWDRVFADQEFWHWLFLQRRQ